MRFHTNPSDAYHAAPKLVAISALLLGAANAFQQPYQQYLLTGGIISGIMGIVLKKDDCNEHTV